MWHHGGIYVPGLDPEEESFLVRDDARCLLVDMTAVLDASVVGRRWRPEALTGCVVDEVCGGRAGVSWWDGLEEPSASPYPGVFHRVLRDWS